MAEVGDGGGWIGTLSVDAGRADVGRAGGHSDDPLSRPRNGHDEAMRQRTLDLLLVSVLAGSAGLTAPVMRSSQQSTPCGSARAASLTGLTSAGRVAWRTTLPHPQDSGTTAEIVAGGTVYADLSGAVTAVNESNGRIRWSRALGTEVHGEWLIGRTLVVDVDQVGRHAQVVGLNPTSGALDWRYRPGGDGLYADPVPAGDVGLVIIASSHELGLVDAASGRLRWHHWTASPDQPVTDGTTVAVAAGNTMRGFAVATGDLRWTRGGIDSSALPTLDEGVVAIGSQVTPDQTPIAGYELATGRRAWTLSLDAGSWQLTATTAGLVAVQEYPVDQGGLDLVEPATGHIAWRSSIGHPAFLATPPVAVGSNLAMVVQLPQDGPSFAALRNLTTGSLVASYRLRSSEVPLTLAALGPDLYGTGLGPDRKTESGFVERIGFDGVIWRLILPQPAQTSPVALPEGGIAIQTEDLGCFTAWARRGR
jgi:outer membrane protein assembly factor BamB